MATFTGLTYSQITTEVNCSSWMSFWGKAFLAFGWKQATDTGQINQCATAMNISQVASAAGSSVYTYDATTMLGPAPQIGNAVTINGFATAGNNVAGPGAIITALGGSGAASTFTVATTTQTNETHVAGGGIASQFNVSQVAVSGGNSVYTYNAAAVTGPALRVGMAIWVTGFATGGNNVSNRNIIALGGSGASSTFTVATTTQVNETHAASVFNTPYIGFSGAGTAALNAAVVGIYEIFQSTDALSSTCPITVRIDYAQSSSAAMFFFQVGLGGTNGAGGLNAPQTGLGIHNLICGSGDNNFRSSFASGDGGNIRMNLNTGFVASLGSLDTFLCISRAYDQTGVQQPTYVMMFSATINKHNQQAIFLSGALGPSELSSWIACMSITGNQSMGMSGNVAVSPVYCVVGGFANPTPDLCIGKGADFAQGTQVTVAFYNVNHNYIVRNIAEACIPSSSCALLMRYE